MLATVVCTRQASVFGTCAPFVEHNFPGYDEEGGKLSAEVHDAIEERMQVNKYKRRHQDGKRYVHFNLYEGYQNRPWRLTEKKS